jgi:hypothetical protein
MKVKELIVLLQQLENQEWDIEYLDGELGTLSINEVIKEDESYYVF